MSYLGLDLLFEMSERKFYSLMSFILGIGVVLAISDAIFLPYQPFTFGYLGIIMVGFAVFLFGTYTSYLITHNEKQKNGDVE